MKWNSIKDKLPKHHQTVLARSCKGYCVVMFVNSKYMNEELMNTPFADECVDIDKNPYYFVSQEIKRHTMNNVTHWCELPDINNEDES
jgi:hypothetical protein